MSPKWKNQWIVFPSPNPAAKLRLFCFHHAGGSGQFFHAWPARLGAQVEVAAIQLPGRGPRLTEPYARDLLPLSRILARELSSYLDRPFAFFGHSLGALLCFETARSLRRENRPQPSHLFLSAAEAPHRRERDQAISALPRDALVDRLREFDGAPDEALRNEELLDLMLPAIRADFELCETYEFQSERPLDCSMTVYGGLEDGGVDSERLAAWSEMTQGECAVRMFPGGHFYINSAQASFLRALSTDMVGLHEQAS
ncbi:thioesterase II family protein [Lysobacter enzymogenes]|uniref:thioesterase II family protein n=1 Tax=Lysobacter enzymogenes TaxID=69 RepID=UPI00099CEFBA|nr:alpha/beta fold hydrolase [Lysobacter enzymogenes]UZW58376.1 alpha/beta fold hydrolase [Lysobacter enzymogenes]